MIAGTVPARASRLPSEKMQDELRREIHCEERGDLPTMERYGEEEAEGRLHAP
jgi:hypothetical protein